MDRRNVRSPCEYEHVVVTKSLVTSLAGAPGDANRKEKERTQMPFTRPAAESHCEREETEVHVRFELANRRQRLEKNRQRETRRQDGPSTT